jgi:hypothetical protein
MTTRINLGEARHTFQEASSLAKQPTDTVDWIVLLDKLEKVMECVEQIGKDASMIRCSC